MIVFQKRGKSLELGISKHVVQRLQKALIPGAQKKFNFYMKGSCPEDQLGSAANFVKVRHELLLCNASKIWESMA